MTISCTRRIAFDTAHRVLEHESNCKYLHGHRFTIEVTFEAEELDELGRVIDFGEVQTLLGDWILEHWDHNTILSKKDKVLGDHIDAITGQSVFYLDGNPTAENIADYLFHHVCPKLFTDPRITCSRVRMYETPNAYVDVTT